MSVGHGDVFASRLVFEQQKLRHVVMVNHFQSLFDLIVQIGVSARTGRGVIERQALRVHESKSDSKCQKYV